LAALAWAQGPKTVKGAQSDPNNVSRLLLDCVPVFHKISPLPTYFTVRSECLPGRGGGKKYSYATESRADDAAEARPGCGYRERVAAEGMWWIRRCWCPCTSNRPRPSASAGRCAGARCSLCVQCEPPTEYCRRPCDSTCSLCPHYITRTPSAERRAVPLPHSPACSQGS